MPIELSRYCMFHVPIHSSEQQTLSYPYVIWSEGSDGMLGHGGAPAKEAALPWNSGADANH